MLKRIVIGILSVVMAATMLTGCSFFEHNYERDYKQIVAEVKAYEIENEVEEQVIDPDTGKPQIDPDTGEVLTQTVTVKYKTQKRTIYKRDLVEYINNNQSTLSQSYSDTKSMVNGVVQLLVNTELVINEADALIDAGLIEWGQAQKNTIKQRVYQVVNGSIVSLQNELLESRDKPTIDTDVTELDEETTYPVKPAETSDEDEVEPEPWEPSLSDYPGLFGDSDERSLGKQAMREFVSLLKSRVADDFRVTDADRKLFKEDDKLIDKTIDERGIQYVYEIIGDTHYMYYLSGKNIERSVKINELQNYLTDSVSVEESEVNDRYTQLLNGQKSTYDNNVSAFETAVTGNSTTVLYYPNSDYFYVKHILLPFSDEQKADLENYAEYATEQQKIDYRKRLAQNIVCYPHVAGEDDKTRPMTVSQVINEIKAVMLPVEDNAKRADLEFDDLIYKYNTDPGAFGNNKGYVVKNAESGNSYMEEFTDAALYMRENLEVGQVYYEPVITDYGVHIMYFASTTSRGEVKLNDYTTPGEVQTYYEIIEDVLRSAKESVRYSEWEQNLLSVKSKSMTKLYSDRYSDLWQN